MKVLLVILLIVQLSVASDSEAADEKYLQISGNQQIIGTDELYLRKERSPENVGKKKNKQKAKRNKTKQKMKRKGKNNRKNRISKRKNKSSAKETKKNMKKAKKSKKSKSKQRKGKKGKKNRKNKKGKRKLRKNRKKKTKNQKDKKSSRRSKKSKSKKKLKRKNKKNKDKRGKKKNRNYMKRQKEKENSKRKSSAKNILNSKIPDQCFKDFAEDSCFYGNQVRNFFRQAARAGTRSTKINKKRKKKDIFNENYKIILDILGGNLNDLSCDGKPVNMSVVADMTTLSECSKSIESNCVGLDTAQEKETEDCKTAAETFRLSFSELAKQGSDEICLGLPDLASKKASVSLACANVTALDKEMVADSKKCDAVFKACYDIELALIPLVYQCKSGKSCPVSIKKIIKREASAKESKRNMQKRKRNKKENDLNKTGRNKKRSKKNKGKKGKKNKKEAKVSKKDMKKGNKKDKRGKNKNYLGKQRNGKNRSNNRQNEECFDSFKKYAVFYGNQARNYFRQASRVLARSRGISNKQGKNDKFKADYEFILKAVGGNKDDPACNGKPANATVKEMMSVLSNCSVNIKSSCTPLTTAELEAAEACKLAAEAYRTNYKSVICGKSITEICTSLDSVSALEIDANLKCASVKSLDQEATKRKKACDEPFKTCKQDTIKGISVMNDCVQCSNPFITTTPRTTTTMKKSTTTHTITTTIHTTTSTIALTTTTKTTTLHPTKTTTTTVTTMPATTSTTASAKTTTTMTASTTIAITTTTTTPPSTVTTTIKATTTTNMNTTTA